MTDPTNSAARPQLRVLHVVFFVINFSVAVLFAIACVVSVAAPESPFAYLGGIVFFLPITLYAVCELVGVFRRKPSIIRLLRYANLACAALALFGVVTNIGEAFIYGDPPSFQFLFWFTVIGCAIVACLGGVVCDGHVNRAPTVVQHSLGIVLRIAALAIQPPSCLVQ